MDTEQQLRGRDWPVQCQDWNERYDLRQRDTHRALGPSHLKSIICASQTQILVPSVMNYLLRSVHNSGFIHIAHFNFDHFETSCPRQNDRKLQDNKGHAAQGIMAHNNDVPLTRETNVQIWNPYITFWCVRRFEAFADVHIRIILKHAFSNNLDSVPCFKNHDYFFPYT